MRKRFGKWEYLGILKKQKMICACGCGERLKRGRIEFNHITAISDGGPDTLDNLEAVRYGCHKSITKGQTKVRAKVKRIRSSKGLTKKRRNRKQKMLQYFRNRDLMP